MQQADAAPSESAALDMPLEKRDSLNGNWVLTLTQGFNNLPLVLLHLEVNGDEVEARVVEPSEIISEPKLSDVSLKDGLLKFSLTSESLVEESIQFEGRLADGLVRGNLGFGDSGAAPARLHGTSARSVAGVEVGQAEGLQELFSAFEAEDSAAALRTFIEKYTFSPLSLIAAERLVDLGRDDTLDESAFEAIRQKYLDLAAGWGPRVKAEAQANIDETLMMRNALIGEGEAHEQAVARLKEKIEESPFQPLLIWALASVAEKAGNTDEAIERYALLTALPRAQTQLMRELGAETPLAAEKLSELWEQKHGNTEELDEYITEAYEKGVEKLTDGHEPVPARPEGEGNQRALVELFTGAHCPPCVAADLATGALEKLYQPSEVIVLRYHQHIPGPDPLTNLDSDARAFYYEAEGTPTVLINGQRFENPGGFLENAPDVLNRLKEEIQPVLQSQTDVQIDLEATQSGDTVTINASATGLPESADRLRLRLVLVEQRIPFNAGNGIRLHEMVVRQMPGGVDGIEPADGKLQAEQTVKLNELRQQLREYLTEFESDFVEFPVKPLRLNDMAVVALVQDHRTKEILQSRLVKIPATAGAAEQP